MKRILVVEKGTKHFDLIAKALGADRVDELLKDNDGRLKIDYPTFTKKYDVAFLTEVIENHEDFGRDLVEKFGAAEYHLRVQRSERVIGYGVQRAFNFTGLYKTKDEDQVKEPKVLDAQGEVVTKWYDAWGVQIAKDLVNAAGNKLTPKLYAENIVNEFSMAGSNHVKVKILDERNLKDLGFNTLLSVAQGSDEPARVVVIEHIGDFGKPIETALIGKGVTFDSGGISLKPGSKMHEMKTDMGGSAAVVGAMLDIAMRDSRANVVGIIGLVENMPSGKAIKPGDVVTSLSGKTVENHNTDAEGRLVLCDLLTYAQQEYKCLNKIIDLATLTGAIVVALGDEYAGLFTNSTDLQESIELCGTMRGEKFWRMPMGKVFRKQLDSTVADIKNIGNGHPGSTTAAEFLYDFVDPKIAWAHLDIAGVAYKKDAATGFGVETLVDFVDAYAQDDFLIDDNMEY